MGDPAVETMHDEGQHDESLAASSRAAKDVAAKSNWREWPESQVTRELSSSGVRTRDGFTPSADWEDAKRAFDLLGRAPAHALAPAAASARWVDLIASVAFQHAFVDELVNRGLDHRRAR